ncbi:MAG: DUF2752 domain-containing protein [Verrucomicrobiaceae bacterium]
MVSERAGKWPRFVLWVPLILIILVLFRLVYPSIEEGLPGCPIYNFTGHFCPGCGGTRAAAGLVNLRIGEAMGNHAWFTLVILVGLPVLTWMAAKEKWPRLKGPRFHVNWLWFCLISLIIFGVIRNVEVFSWLAPDSLSAPGR